MLLGPFWAAGQRKVWLLPSTLRGASSLKKSRASLSPACSSPCPGGARSWGLRSPGCTSQLGDPDSLFRTPFSRDSKPAAAAAAAPTALLSRLPGPPRGSGRTWAAAARRWRGWASSTCSSARWPHGSRRAGRRQRALCAPGDAVLTRPAPPRCILIPGHCGRCTPSRKPLAGVGRVGGALHRCARVSGLVGEMWGRAVVFMRGHVCEHFRLGDGCTE